MSVDPSLNPFFAPQGIAVIGASHDPSKLGYGLSRNLVQSGFQGVVHFVNIKGGSLMGRPVYQSIDEVPDPVDLAAVLIPAQYIPDALHACGQRGIRAAIIGAGGFRETGPEGAALEEELLSIARQYGMRLLGPNCIGMLDTHYPIDTTFLPPPGPTAGDVAFISHSGAICAAVIDWARGQGFGLSRLVSLGNQADINETDVLAPVAEDSHTRVLTLYLEGVSDGRRFVEEARKVSLEKPVIALKVGRFKSGKQAVASHTGALAGQETAFNAAFCRAGVLRADTSEEMFDWARSLAWCPPVKGKRVAVLTNAGGPGVTAADALESLGHELAVFSPETHAALREILPPAASTHNPVDLLASASPKQFSESLRIVLEDPGVDSAMVIFPPPPMFTAGAVAMSIIPVVHNSDKPVVIALMGERLIQEAVEHFRAARIPEYRFPERAAAALAVLNMRSEYLECALDDPILVDDVDANTVREIISQAEDGFLPHDAVQEILSAYRVPHLPLLLSKTPGEAVRNAESVGFPVALKIDSPDIPHKTDAGGIALNLIDAESVREAYRKILDNVQEKEPDARVNGVLVQHMSPVGQEVIIGGVQDVQFGGIVMFGSGGVEVEGMKDVAFALTPLTNGEARRMLENTWAGKKLEGFRDNPPADRAAVIDILYRFAQLTNDFPELVELEINPLRVLHDGQGAAAVDVRIRLEKDIRE